ISQKEYYQFYAFFHNVPEQGLDGRQGNAAPVLKVPSAAQRDALARFDRQLQELEAQTTDKAKIRAESERVRKARTEFEKQVPTAMVMAEMPSRRDTYLLLRGAYDKPAQKVEAGTPAFLPPLQQAPPS